MGIPEYDLEVGPLVEVLYPTLVEAVALDLRVRKKNLVNPEQKPMPVIAERWLSP